jgi:hypothetical protein
MAITQYNLSTPNEDLRLQKMLSQEIRLLLADSTNLRNTPFVDFVGSINGMGSDTIRVRKAGLDGFDAFSAFTGATEVGAVSDSNLTDGHVDVVCKRNSLAYAISDLASMTAMGAGDIDPFRIAESIANSYEALFAELTGAAVAGFTTVKGSTGAALDVATFLEAINALEAAASGKGAPGPYVALLHPKQWADIQDDILTLTSGVLQFVAASYEAISAKGSHYKGNFMGVEIYTSSYITDDSTDYTGAIFAPGALGYATGMPAGLPGAAEAMEMGEVMIEMDREADKALTRIVGHAYLGMSIIDDQRGVALLSVM